MSLFSIFIRAAKRVKQPRSIVLIALLLSIGMTAAQATNKKEVFALIKNGQLGDANTQMEKLLTDNPQDPELLFAKGLLAEKQGNKKDAIAIYQGLTRTHPGILAPYNNLALLHAEAGNYEAAIGILESALVAKPDTAIAYRNLTTIFARMASEAYRKALNSESSNTPLALTSIDTIQPSISQPPAIVASVENFVNESLRSENPETESNQTENVVAATDTNSDLAESANVSVLENANENSTLVTPTVEEVELVQSSTNPDDNAVTATQDTETKIDSSESEMIPEPIIVSASTDTALAKQAVENNAAQKQALINHIKSWAKAWSDRDVDNYLSHYSNDFSPRDNLSFEEWKKQRHGRLRWRKFIIVKPSKYSINVDGDTATVNFSQYYKSDRFEDTIRKTMKLVKENGRWLITKELI